jgi:CheY-like chemotaxis protein
MSEETVEPPGLLDGVHVLLVEDERDARELMTAVLEYAGALVTVAPSARAGLTVLETVRPDVLVSDIRMPGADGFWLIRRVRARPATRDLPALAVTALSSRDDRKHALDEGFQAHLAKPVDPWELCRVVADLAGRR